MAQRRRHILTSLAALGWLATTPVGPASTIGRVPGEDRQTATMAYPTGDLRTSVMLVEKEGPAEAPVGRPFEYEIRVKNLTRAVLHDVVIAETLAGLTVLSCVPATEDVTEDVIRWRLGDLEPRSERRIKVTARSADPGTALSSTSVHYNQTLGLSTRIVQPQLRVTLTGPEELLLGETAALQVEVTNEGTGAAHGMVVHAVPSEGMRWADGHEGEDWELGTVGVGKSRVLVLPVTASSKGRFECQVRVSGEGVGDIDLPVHALQVRGAALVVTRPPQETTTVADRPVDFVTIVRNDGDAPALDVRVEEQIPDSYAVREVDDNASVKPGYVTWTVGTIAPGEQVELHLGVHAQAAGSFRSRVLVQAKGLEDVVSDMVTEVQGIAAILLEVVDTDDPVPLGDTTTYVIIATNTGTASDHDIQVHCSWETPWLHEESGGSTEALVSGSAISFRPLDELAPGQKATWTVTLRGRDVGDTRFRVAMSSERLVRPVKESESTVLYK